MFKLTVKHKVGDVGIVVTRNKGMVDEYQEDYGVHTLYEDRFTFLGNLLNHINIGITTIKNKLKG